MNRKKKVLSPSPFLALLISRKKLVIAMAVVGWFIALSIGCFVPMEKGEISNWKVVAIISFIPTIFSFLLGYGILIEWRAKRRIERVLEKMNISKKTVLSRRPEREKEWNPDES